MTTTNKINIYKELINKANINDREFMTWLLQGWNSFDSYNDMTLDDMILADIEMNDLEYGQESTDQEIKEGIEMHIDMYLSEIN
jgi:hypothetical protein